MAVWFCCLAVAVVVVVGWGRVIAVMTLVKKVVTVVIMEESCLCAGDSLEKNIGLKKL